MATRSIRKREPPPRVPRKSRVPADGAGAGHTQALSRGLAVLDALADTDHGATLSQLCAALLLPAPTVHRLLATLAHQGFVETGVSGEWRIGVRAFRTGSAFLSHRNLVAQALPHLDALMRASGETANLAVVEQGEAVFVAQSPCRELMRMSAKLGARAPLHASGVGKALLAGMDGTAAAFALATRPLARYTPRTIVTQALLAAELAAIRACGYAVDDEEHALGLRCVAAPIYDESGRSWAALSLAGPTSRLGASRLAELGTLVRTAALEVTVALGGVTPRP